MFGLIFGAFFFTALLFVTFFAYIVTAFIFTKLGEKFKVGSFLGFLIPVYNVMLLCDCAKISRWLTLCIVAPGIAAFIINAFTFSAFVPVLGDVSSVVATVSAMLLFGKIAKRLGKNPWLWGIGTVLFMGLPIFLLALDSSRPAEFYR